MLTFHQRTEIIREMIADRMKFSPHPADISLSELQNWPEVLVWGTPEGTIFNIVTSYDLNLKQGCDPEEAIRAIEELEKGNTEVFTGRNLTEYLIFRLQNEHPQFVHLYQEELLESLRDLIRKRFQMFECQTFKTGVPTPEVVTEQLKIKDFQPVTKKDVKTSSNGKVMVVSCVIILSIIITGIVDMVLTRKMEEKREFEAIGYSVERFMDYVRKYPDSKYNTEEVLENLLDVAVANGIPALNRFVDKCSGNVKYSKQIKQAKSKLNDLYNQSYKKCIEANTIECWDEFIRLSPPEKLQAEAKRRRYQLIELKDKLIMNKIRQISTLKECDSLRSVYCEEKYRKLLNKKYIDLYVRDFQRKGQCESIAKLYSVNKYDTTSSTIVFKNNMNYNLMVYYSGKESGQIAIDAQKSERLSIPNGKIN